MTIAADLINTARTNAEALSGTASSAMEAAQSAISNIPYTVVSYDLPPLGAYPVFPPLGDVPDSDPGDFDPGSAPGLDAMATIPTVALGSLPEFYTQAPVFHEQNKPSSVAPFTPGVANVNFDLPFPDVPQVLLNPFAEPPTFPDRTEPSKPGVHVPSFDALTPTGAPAAPSDLAGVYQASYADAAPSMITMVNGYVDAELTKLNPEFHIQMGKIEAQLSKYLAGGTGLSAAVEDAIYARARSKNDAEARRVRDQALADAAARGFTMPAGALLSATQQARQAGADNNAKAASEIVVMQAEMEQKNLQFAVTTSTGLRTMMVNATLSYMQNLGALNGQAVESARTVMSAVVEVFNTAVKAFAAKLDAYRAEAAVYDTRLKAAMAGLELYKSEIQALEAMTRVDMNAVNIYKARIDTLQSAAAVYRAQVDGAVGRMGLERLKLDMVRTQVDTYAATVQAKTAEWQGYSAAVQGEVAKVQAYSASASAYAARVQGYRATIEAQSEAVKAAGMTNDAIGKKNSAALDAFRIEVQQKGEIARAKVAIGGLKIQAYEARARNAVAGAQAAAEHYKAVATTTLEAGRISVQAMVESAKVELERGKAIAQVAVANGQVHANMAGAAMAGITALAADTASTSG